MDDRKINKIYSIDGCLNENLKYHYNSNYSLLQKKPYKKFKNEFEAFKKDLINKYNSNASLTYIHLEEGEIYFLNKESCGNATVGKRDLSIPYEKFDITPFYEGFNKNTHICIEVLKHSLLDKFNKLYPNNIISGKGVKKNYVSNRKSIPTEFLYGIVSNKWIFKNFDSIGLIGADEKIFLIKKLMEYKEYQNYLGVKEFKDYIYVPQKFACDNLNKVRKSIKLQLQKSKSKIFLVGVGHVKCGLFHLLKDYKKAIFLDVGIYIDALAGLIDYKRPYAANWINFGLRDYDYSKIDDLQYKPKHERYLGNFKFYDLDNLSDINGNRNDVSYQSPKTWPTYQEDYKKFKKNILHWSKNNESKVLLRAYDGEFLFLQGEKNQGNVSKRHVSIELTEDIVKQFYENSLKCDSLSSHLTVLPNGKMYELYKSVYGSKKIDYPMEFHYGIVISKWIFKHFKNKIGIIAGNEKIKIIKELIKKEKYRKYLGIDYFTDYVEVPERFSCDNPDELDKSIKIQLKNAKAKIFLFGIGISKLAVAHNFKKHYPAIYIDIGVIMSGLAGFLTKNRPYSASWINYRMKDYDYSEVDKMDTKNNENIDFI